MRRRGLGDFAEKGKTTVADSEGHVTGAVNRQQAMNALEMEEWRNVRGKKKCKVARPNDKLVVRARVIYKTKRTGQRVREVQISTYRLRVLADRRNAILTHSRDCVNPNWCGDGSSGRGRRGYVTLMQRGHSQRRVLARKYTFKISEGYQEFSEVWGC